MVDEVRLIMMTLLRLNSHDPIIGNNTADHFVLITILRKQYYFAFY